MAVAPRVSLLTLGVRDVDRAEAFYRALGWEVVLSADDGFRVFRTDGAWLTLCPAESLWADAGIPPPAEPGFRGVLLAMNLDSPADVDEAIATAAAAGGTVLKPATALDWGFYHGHIADPDGHVWEIAYNPGWPIGEDGRPTIS
jgi:predicted lactoylglutathione lyase